MKNELMAKAERGFNKIIFGLKKHSPEILVAVGICGAITSTILACKATTKISSVLDKAHKDLEPIREVQKSENFSENYTREDLKKDLAIVYIQTGLGFAKLYVSSIIVGSLSIVAVLSAIGILKKRSVALTAAYAAIDRSFKEYRERVTARFGERVDRELKYNLKSKEIEEHTVDEKGREKTEKKTVDITEVAHDYSDYARFFDDGCEGWEKDSEYNLMFLRSEQNYANDKLKARGYLFLNEVYERLGISPTKAGQVVGWLYKPNDPKHNGDNYVDFGIYEIYREGARDFVNGRERSILLDFNVDGPIINSIEDVNIGVC